MDKQTSFSPKFFLLARTLQVSNPHNTRRFFVRLSRRPAAIKPDMLNTRYRDGELIVTLTKADVAKPIQTTAKA